MFRVIAGPHKIKVPPQQITWQPRNYLSTS